MGHHLMSRALIDIIADVVKIALEYDVTIIIIQKLEVFFVRQIFRALQPDLDNAEVFFGTCGNAVDVIPL